MSSHPTDAPTPGRRVGDRYTLVEELGRGGLCMVWRAEDDRARRQVALKWLKPEYVADARLRRRLHREARAVARLEHPHIVRLYDIAEDPALGPFIAMEWLRGMSFTERLRVGLSLDEVLDATGEILDALAFAHDRGVVHRDLKPDNVVIATDVDGRETVKLLDFGFAWLEDDADAHISRADHDVFGTPTYMAPEQIQGDGELGPWTDLYALCVMLWELCTGDPPFTGRHGTAVVVQHVTAPLPPFRPIDGLHVPDGLEALLRRGLEKEPARRFADAAEFRRALDAVRAGEGDASAVVDPDEGPLIGRLDVQRWLWNHAVRVCEEKTARAVLIEADPGLGRTRIGRWLEDTLADGGWMLAGMAGADADGLRAALRRALGLPLVPDAPHAEALVTAFEALGQLSSDAIDPLCALLWGQGPLTASAPFEHAVRILAARRPLLLVIDDLHRGTPDALHALDHLIGALTRHPAPVMLLLTRLTEPERSNDGFDDRIGGVPVAEELVRRRRGVLAMRRLDPISRDAMTMFAGHVLGLDPDTASPVLAAAGGNPLHATHLVYALHERGRLRRTATGYVAAGPIGALPADSIALTRSRLDRLFADPAAVRERRLAECFALFGERVPQGAVRALAAAFEVEAEQIVEGLDALVERSVMERDEDGGHVFTHRLIAEALCNDVRIRSDAAILYGRVADAMSRLRPTGGPPTAADIAERSLAGGAIDPAVRYQIAASLDALAAGFPRAAGHGLDEAAAWLEWVVAHRERRAAELQAARATWALATEQWGRAQSEGETAAAWAEEAGEYAMAALCHRVAGAAALAARRYDDAAVHLRCAEAQAEAVERPERTRRMLFGARFALARGLYPEARNRMGQAESRFERLGDLGGLAEVRLAQASLAERLGEAREAEGRLIEALALGDALGDEGLRGRALLGLGDHDRRARRTELAIERYEAAIEALGHAARTASRARALRGLGECRRRLGGQNATEPFRQALALFEARGDTAEAAACAARLGHVAFERAAWAESEAFYRRALAALGETQDPRAGLLHGFIARCAHRRGDAETRAAHLKQALQIDSWAEIHSAEWAAILDEIAAALDRAGEGVARRLAERAQHVRARRAVAGPGGSIEV
ncbi:MAG: protein kinase [Myxococcales bacterium]|nr:protein kinase [Myxococcales bacterium]